MAVDLRFGAFFLARFFGAFFRVLARVFLQALLVNRLLLGSRGVDVEVGLVRQDGLATVSALRAVLRVFH